MRKSLSFCLFLFINLLCHSQELTTGKKVNNIRERIVFVDSLKMDHYMNQNLFVDGTIKSKKKLFSKQKIIGAFFERYTFENDYIAKLILGHRLFSDSTNTIRIYIFDSKEDLCYYQELKYYDKDEGMLVYKVEYYLEAATILLDEKEGDFNKNIENHLQKVIGESKRIKSRKKELINYD